MDLYAITIFLGAFLLFQVQPMIAKMILPWFGGSAAVWTTCMVFFQAVLLLGYLYADRSVRRLSPSAQGILHAALLAACTLFLPIAPWAAWKPAGPEDPLIRILGVLSTSVGLPFLVLSGTSPLLQAWFARTRGGAAPYRLFAVSNAGSMLGLLAYPTLVEPFLPLRRQGQAWSAAFLAFAALCGILALRSRTADGAASLPDKGSAGSPGRGMRFRWAALAAVASILLLAVTNHLCQNVAAIPFLWILPLSLYLASFIACFSGNGKYYPRTLFLLLLVPAAASMAVLTAEGSSPTRLALLLPVFSIGLFACCMVCHGELARVKPAPRHLTSYYLAISLGGVAGGAFVGLLAPNLFDRIYELHVGLAALGILVTSILGTEEIPPLAGKTARLARRTIPGFLTLALVGALAYPLLAPAPVPAFSARNFYGSLRVKTTGGTDGWAAMRTLIDGVVTHGTQFLHGERRRRPTTYYGPRSGAGLALLAGRRRPALRVGVVGLGAGTLAAYGRPGDAFRFYEINPLVIEVARREFSYLADSAARIEIVPGDARLSLAQEPSQGFDLLAIDAFSSDAIPVHLLTLEAFDLYFRHVKEDGILAFHVTNGYFDLAPAVQRAAESKGRTAVLVSTGDDDPDGIYGSDWVLVTGRGNPLWEPPLIGAWRTIRTPGGFPAWTDDYCNLVGVLK